MRPPTVFVKYSFLCLFLGLFVLGFGLSLTYLGSEDFLLEMWRISISNPLFVILSGFIAVPYGYLRSLRNEVLETDVRLDLLWWTFMPCLAIYVLYLSSLIILSYLLTGHLPDSSLISTLNVLLSLLPLFAGSIIGHLIGAARSEPHRQEFLIETG